MRKAIVVVLLSFALCAPAVAGFSNGFNSDYCYALQGANVVTYNQATGANMGTVGTGFSGETLTFSGSSVPGQYTPAGARLFTASAFDRSGDTRADDICISEWDSAGNELRRTYLYTAVGGYLAPNLSYGLALGTIRYNPVNKTLIVSANPSNNNPTIQLSKAWEIALPDWQYTGSVTGGTATLVHTYTLLDNKKNRTCIDVAPDGTMYVTGYNYGTSGSGRPKISKTPTNPADPNFGVNTVVLDGPAYYAATADSQFYQQSAIVWREVDRAGDGVMVPELNTAMESAGGVYQPYAWDWVGPYHLGLGPFGEVGRIGTPGDDSASSNWRCRGVRAQRDPLTGEAFIVGNQSDGTQYGGVLQVTPVYPRNSNSQVFDPAMATSDAASPIPEPATLVLLGLGGVLVLRRRRA